MKTKKWYPKKGEDYWYLIINDFGVYVGMQRNMGDKWDKCLMRLGNTYKTKAEANKKLKLIKAILKQP